MSIRIAKGLKASYKNARDYTIEQALLELDKYTDNYEVLNLEYNRVYGDIDGKDMNCSEEEFKKLDAATQEAIEKFLNNTEYCLLTATSFAHKKISWRFVILDWKSTLPNNKKFVVSNINTIALPKGISFDSAPYGKNQKIRMLGSNKDGENRPLRLVKGTPTDTLISYVPDDCVIFPLESEEEEEVPQTHKKKNYTKNTTLIKHILMNITNTIDTTWEQWYKVAQALFNEGLPLDLFLAWSAKSPKHNEYQAIKDWGSLKQGGESKLGAGSLFYWSKSSNPTEYEKIIVEYSEPDDYYMVKLIFEKTHFKLLNPLCFVKELKSTLQILSPVELSNMYENLFFYDTDGKKRHFVKSWVLDTDMRTYQEIVFQPMREVEKGIYNLFQGFPTPKKEGDISVMKDLMWNLSGKDIAVFEYIENYFAHLIQKPYHKAKKCLVFSTEKEGAGKDTPLDAIGKIIGKDYFYNTGNPENDVFGRFNGHLQKTLLLKLEEVSFEVNKKFESNLLNLITAATQSYEDKGRKSINLDDYKRIVMTTNKNIPVSIKESDRRFVLINSSEDRVGDFDYWKKVYAELNKPETLEAYHWHLSTKDISQFDLEKRPITEFYKDVKLSLRPYHASYFQQWLSHNGDIMEKECKPASEWIEDINAHCKYTITLTKFGRDIKPYLEAKVFERKVTRYGCSYTITSSKMMEFLKKKSWWMDA